MMRAWVGTDAEGRVNVSVTDEQYAEGMVEVEVDDGFDFGHQGDYLLKDGELVYDGAQTAAEEAARQEAESEEEALRQRRMAVPMLLSALAESMDDDELASVALALPDWEPGVKRKRGAACRHGGVAYRVVANVSKNNDAEPGTPEGADYYAPVDIGPSGVQAWEPDGRYMKGERVEHGGRVWESLKNNNREEPGTGDRWAEVADGADG